MMSTKKGDLLVADVVAPDIPERDNMDVYFVSDDELGTGGADSDNDKELECSSQSILRSVGTHKRNRKPQNKFSSKENQENNNLSLSMGTKHERLSITYPSEEIMIKDQISVKNNETAVQKCLYEDNSVKECYINTVQSIQVEQNDNGDVQINFTSDKDLSTKKSKIKKKEGEKKKNTLDSCFVKSGTLIGGTLEGEEEMDEIVTEDMSKALTDEEFVEACGGLTAHKGSRHGHKMDAKLLQVQKNKEEISKIKQKKKKRNRSVDPDLINEDAKKLKTKVEMEHIEVGARKEKKKNKKSERSHKKSSDIEDNKVDGIRYKCNDCDYQGTTNWHLKRHIESKHDGIRYKCDECNYEAKREWNLKIHVQSFHKGIRYKCDVCDYQGTTNWHLKRHIESKHDGIRYKCDECDYEAKREWNLKVHVESFHNGIRYKCDKCDYQGMTKWHLKRHFDSSHGKIRYKCDECDYQGKRKWHLKRHVEYIHNRNCFKKPGHEEQKPGHEEQKSDHEDEEQKSGHEDEEQKPDHEEQKSNHDEEQKSDHEEQKPDHEEHKSGSITSKEDEVIEEIPRNDFVFEITHFSITTTISSTTSRSRNSS